MVSVALSEDLCLLVLCDGFVELHYNHIANV